MSNLSWGGCAWGRIWSPKRDKHLTLLEACKHQSLKHIVNINCWLQVWDKALDRGYAGTCTTAIQKLIWYLAIPTFSDRCQYCTRSIDPNITYAEHLITCKSLPITLRNMSIQSLRTLKTPFSDFLKLSLTCYFHSTLCGIVLYILVCLYSKRRGIMKLEL